MWKYLKKLGPGLVTGASDDDPSGILTYLQFGVVAGFGALSAALFTLPLMYAMQEMCARLGYVTGKGLMRLIRDHFAKPFAIFIGLTAAGVMIINIGADLYAVSVILEKLVPLSRFVWLPLAAIAVIFSMIFFSYRRFAGILKWLAFSLVFYVAAAFYLEIDFFQSLKATLMPSISFSKETFLLIAAVFGTTISPYLFFWQASEEAEERSEKKRINGSSARVNKRDMRVLREDTFLGMFFSNLAMWFIIAGGAAAASLYGFSDIGSFEEASLVLKPILGDFAFLVFGLGIVGTGLIAIPVLAGSVGYIAAEMFGWSEGLNKKFGRAHGFYGAIIAATLLGVGIVYSGFNPIQLLIYTALLFALITPPIIYAVMRLANNPAVMGKRTNSPLSNFLGWLAFLLMTGFAAAYVVSWFR